MRNSLVILSALALSNWALASSQLREITVNKAGSGVEVLLKGVDLGSPKEIKANSGRSFILEYPGTLNGNFKLMTVEQAGLLSVHASVFTARPPKIRVMFRLLPGTEPQLVKTDEGMKLTFGDVSFVKMVDEASGSGLPFVSDSTKQPLKNPTPEKPKTPESEVFKLPQVQQPIGGESAPLARNEPKPQTKPAPKINTPNPQASMQKRVSLDFVNTEVGIVLKALMTQANANIVTSPDIKGQITITMERVTVEEALDMITALSGLRYAQVNRTFVVAPKEKFGDIMRQVSKSADKASETRIVPIYSGEVDQIQQAVMRAFPPDNSKGSFDIIVPGNTEEKGSKTKAKDGEKDSGDASESVSAKSRGSMGPMYVILVGNPDALDEAQKVVEQVDRTICKTYGIDIPDTNEIISETYLIASETMPAKHLLDTVKNQAGTAFQNVEMYPSPIASDRQAIIIRGRKTEVARAKKMLEEFDGASDEVMPYDVKFRDPRALRDQLNQAVPGLRVVIGASPVTNLKAYEAPPKTKSKNNTDGKGGEDVSTETVLQKDASDVGVKSTSADATGLAQPFEKAEQVTRPMRLLLRGSKVQLQRALDYLKVADIAVKQVALDLRVMELSKDDALRVGLDWSASGILNGQPWNIRSNQGLGDSAISPGTFSGAGSIGSVAGNFLASLDQITNNRNLIARPNVIATDGKASELFVGDVIRYIESIQTTQNGITVTTNQIRVGVRCAVLVRVGADNRISMDLQPIVSYLRGFTPVPGGGQLPQTSERIANSTVTMMSGDTVVIGGLIKDEDRKVVSGIPLLKDIPIIGKLFSRTDNSRQRSEVVIFLTARVVDVEGVKDSALPRANEQRNTENPVKVYPDPFEKGKKEKKG